MSRSKNNKPKSIQPDNYQPPWLLIIIAIIAALGTIIAAYLIATQPVILTIDATQTAEALHTSIAMTTQAYLLLPTDTLTPSFTPISIMTQTGTPTLNPLPTDTPLPTETPSITPLPPASYGGLHFDCIPTDYWYLTPGPTPEPGFCWLLSGWGLHAEDKSLRLNIANTGFLEKAIFMNIPSTENVNISFSSIVNSIRGSDKESFSSLAIGICDPNDYHNKNDFIYYTLYQPNQPTISIRVNGFGLDNISNYYYDYVNAMQNLDFSLMANDLSVSVDGSKKIPHQFVDRTSITAFCVYYSVPRSGQLDASIENIFIQDK